MGHQKIPEARNVECRNCGKTGLYNRIWRMRQRETKQNKTNTRKKVFTQSPWRNSEDESGEEIEVMPIDNTEKVQTNHSS